MFKWLHLVSSWKIVEDTFSEMTCLKRTNQAISKTNISLHKHFFNYFLYFIQTNPFIFFSFFPLSVSSCSTVVPQIIQCVFWLTSYKETHLTFNWLIVLSHSHKHRNKTVVRTICQFLGETSVLVWAKWVKRLVKDKL